MNTGTRQHFGDWLAVHKKLTYSRYSQLDTAAKLKIQAEYTRKPMPKVEVDAVREGVPDD